MLAVLTGTGLSAASGLNAYIPLLLLGLVARFTGLVPLGAGWQWLEHPITLGALAVLLVVEFLADKFPVVDSINDAVQTLVRPTSGGITFGAGASSITLEKAAAIGEAATGDGSLWPIVSGAVIAFALHAVKSLARPLINAVTAGVGGAVTGAVEDVSSLALAALAILIPIAVLLFIPVFVFLVVWLVRARKRRKRTKAAQREGSGTASHQHPGPPGR